VFLIIKSSQKGEAENFGLEGGLDFLEKDAFGREKIIKSKGTKGRKSKGQANGPLSRSAEKRDLKSFKKRKKISVRNGSR